MYWNLNDFGYMSIICFWLTLTWDVLKWECGFKPALLFFRLTLTWDVLKSDVPLKFVVFVIRLTLTWDVLKCVSTKVLDCEYYD